MQCPFCRADDTKVVDSRLGGEGLQIRRRRECMECANRFTTYESIELSLPRLVKRDGRQVSFDEQKLRTGILKSLEKRPISMSEVDNAVQNIINKLRFSGERELPTERIGEWVMQELRKLDEVAYVRFASVYRHFEDVDAFKDEISKLKQSVSEDIITE